MFFRILQTEEAYQKLPCSREANRKAKEMFGKWKSWCRDVSEFVLVRSQSDIWERDLKASEEAVSVRNGVASYSEKAAVEFEGG